MEEKVVGKWTGNMKMPEAKKDDPAAAMAQAFGSMMKMDLELKKDKTFAMTAMIIPIEGTWAISGNKVIATPTKVMGMAIDEAKKLAADQAKKQGTALAAKQADEMNKPMELTISPDGKTLTMKGTGATADQGEVAFTKSSS